MKRTAVILSIISLIATGIASAGTMHSYLSPEIVQPHVTHLKLKSQEVKALTERQVIVRPISTSNSREMTGLGIIVADATPESFTDSFRSLEYFKGQPSVMASGKFSAAPKLSDLKDLTIDNKDLLALAKSKVGDSDIKLSKAEIARIEAIVGPGKQLTPAVKARLAEEYKKMLVERVKSYLAEGGKAMAPLNDKEEPLQAHEAFLQMVKEQASTSGHCAQFYQALSNFPESMPQDQDNESYVYWAKQKFGDMKPVINVVHVVIHRDGSRVLIASKQLYCSHYTDAALSVAELIPFNDNQGTPRTLVAYSLRLQVDMLGGALGFMKKRMAQPRILSALRESLLGLRSNMEATTQASISSRASL